MFLKIQFYNMRNRCKNDKEVEWAEIQESQKELNGHTSMLIKCFKIGSYWKHGDRVREN